MNGMDEHPRAPAPIAAASLEGLTHEECMRDLAVDQVVATLVAAMLQSPPTPELRNRLQEGGVSNLFKHTRAALYGARRPHHLPHLELGVAHGNSAKLPPCNDRAEMALLGALMANNLAAARMGGFLGADHFADPVHGIIFTAIMRRIAAGQLADAVTLRAEFEHSGKLDEVGGTGYLWQLLGVSSDVIDVRNYAASITDAWLKRQVIDLGEQTLLAAQAAIDQAFGEEVDGAFLDGSNLAQRLFQELRRLSCETAAAIQLCLEQADHAKAGKGTPL